jgi:hypothetical protein
MYGTRNLKSKCRKCQMLAQTYVQCASIRIPVVIHNARNAAYHMPFGLRTQTIAPLRLVIAQWLGNRTKVRVIVVYACAMVANPRHDL